MNKDCPTPISLLKVDGGASRNNFLMQFQADLLGIAVERPAILDATYRPGCCFWGGFGDRFLG